MVKDLMKDAEVLEVLSYIFICEELSVLERWQLLNLTFNLLDNFSVKGKGKLILIRSEVA
jgi:hypothetical protein